MRRALALALAGGASLALAQDPPPVPEPWVIPAAELKGVKNPVVRAALPGSVKKGAAIYKAECASCHGDAGHGDGPDGLYFVPPPPRLTGLTAGDAELFLKTTRGRGNMTSYEAKLDVAQRWDVVNFVKTLKE
jgi:high-affinity iron transporter